MFISVLYLEWQLTGHKKKRFRHSTAKIWRFVWDVFVRLIKYQLKILNKQPLICSYFIKINTCNFYLLFLHGLMVSKQHFSEFGFIKLTIKSGTNPYIFAIEDSCEPGFTVVWFGCNDYNHGSRAYYVAVSAAKWGHYEVTQEHTTNCFC